MKEMTEDKVQKLISDILKVYTQTEVSDKVRREIQTWLINNSHKKEKETALRNLWYNIEIKDKGKEREKKAWKEISRKIGLKQTRYHLLSRSTSVRIAAIIIPTIFITGGIYLILNNRQELPITAEVEQTIIRTVDEIKHILLTDGTEVWINKESELTYGDNREVHLKGEALFKIHHMNEQQFTVVTEHLRATAIGTSFNIHAYPELKDIAINLYEGKLEVNAVDTIFQMLPGDECIIDRNLNTLQIRRTHKNSPDWNRNHIDYGEVRLENVFKDLETKYSVKIEGANAEILNDVLTLKFEQNISIDEIMLLISHINGKFDYTNENNIIKIYPETNN